MYDANTSRGRGRGRGFYNAPRGPRGGGYNHFSQNDRRQHEEPINEKTMESNPAFKLMKEFLGRRYDADNKLLNLSTIASDQEIINSGMFATEGAQKKFFPALMKVCDSMIPDPEAREVAINSVTLSGNNLQNTHVVYTLVHTFRHIKNLDLSNNAFATLSALQPWKGRFRNLEHLIVDPFAAPGWEEELTAWFPKLKILNGIQVRGDDVAGFNQINTSNSINDINPMNPMNNNINLNNQNTAPAQIPMTNTPPIPQQPIPDPDLQRKEEMILYVQQQTNLKRDFAVQCLEAGGWNIDQAGVLFAQSQPSLPAEAYN